MLKIFRDNLRYLSWILWIVIIIFVAFVFVDFGGPVATTIRLAGLVSLAFLGNASSLAGADANRFFNSLKLV